MKIRLCCVTICFLTSFFATINSHGQVLRLAPGQTEIQPKSSKDKTIQTLNAELKQKPVTLSARKEPDPALKYRLWVSPNLRQPGNAVAPILRAQVLWFEKKPSHNQGERLTKAWEWLELPIDELPEKEVREFIDMHRHVLDELHLAEKMERIDYEMRFQDLRGPEVFAVLLPELQVCRELARLLSLDARFALKERRFDDAFQSMRSSIRLAEISAHLGSHTLIGQLVSIAIASTTLQVVEDAIQVPDAPNLYWALASIPDSFGDMRMALEGEALAVQHVFHHVIDLPDENASEAVWQAHLQATIRDFMGLQNSIAELKASEEDYASLLSGALLGTYGDAAIAELAKEQSDVRMSRAEAILRMTRRDILRAQSDFFKWALLPSSQRKSFLDQAERSVFEVRTGVPTPAKVIISLVFPAVNAASAAGSRLLIQRNALLTLEALRAHAAEHQGKLPASLADLSPLPAWKQPHNLEYPAYQLLNDQEATLTRASIRPQDPPVQWSIKLRSN